MSEIHLLFVFAGAGLALAVLKFGVPYLLRCVAAFLAALADGWEFVARRTAEYRDAAGASPKAIAASEHQVALVEGEA